MLRQLIGKQQNLVYVFDIECKTTWNCFSLWMINLTVGHSDHLCPNIRFAYITHNFKHNAGVVVQGLDQAEV